MNKLKILLVEDDPLLADLTSFRLELLEYEVHVQRDCESAFQTLRKENFHLAIIDLELDDQAGLELIHRIHETPETLDIKVLAISTDADLDVVQKAYEAGAQDYLVTPYDPVILEQKVEQLFRSLVSK